MGAVDILKEKVVKPFTSLTVAECCLSAFVGLLGGCFPIPALTTIVTAFLCRLFDFSTAQVAAAMVVNMLSTPLELMLIPVFATTAAAVIGSDASTFTSEFLMQTLSSGGVMQLFEVASALLAHAVIAWTILCAVACLVLRVVLPRQAVAKAQ